MTINIKKFIFKMFITISSTLALIVLSGVLSGSL